MIAPLTLILALGALLLVRNHMAYQWVLRMIDEAHLLNSSDIAAGRPVDIDLRYEKIPSHGALMFNLLLWRYRSPFGG